MEVDRVVEQLDVGLESIEPESYITAKLAMQAMRVQPSQKPLDEAQGSKLLGQPNFGNNKSNGLSALRVNERFGPGLGPLSS